MIEAVLSKSHFRSIRRIAGVAAVVFAAAGASACSSGETTGPTGLSGRWTGSFTNSGNATSLSLLMLDKSGTVTGNGTFTSGGTFAINVTGTFLNPNLSATISSPGFVVMNFTGNLSGQNLTGTLNGSGYVNQPLTLVRQ